MRPLTLAYRDTDRLPFIFCVREMARRHYDVDVVLTRPTDSAAYEAALFDGTCEVIIEHLEYLYAEARRGKAATMFCAPILGTSVELVVRPEVDALDELKGAKIAVRGAGRPVGVSIRLKAMGLEDTTMVLVGDAEVGRWGLWKKVVSGECMAAFVSPLYLAEAEHAGLKVMPTPDIAIVGQFAQACTTELALNDALIEDYVRAVIHAICLIKYEREEALEIVLRASADLAADRGLDAGVQLDVLGRTLSTVPYPPPEAIANTYRVACAQDPAAEGLDPLTLWDPRWVTRLDASGFIAGITGEMSTAPERPR